MGEVDAELVHARAEVARQLRHGAVAGTGAGRQPPPEALDRGPVMRAHRVHGLRHLLAGELAHEIEMGEIAFDDMRIGVDHGMIELDADIASGKTFERHRLSSLSTVLLAALALDVRPRIGAGEAVAVRHDDLG